MGKLLMKKEIEESSIKSLFLKNLTLFLVELTPIYFGHKKKDSLR
jgi:hypothetical protein